MLSSVSRRASAVPIRYPIRFPTMTIPLAQNKPGYSKRTNATSSQASSKPLYASQASLPHLPVPTLSSTFNKYLETLQPLLTPEQLNHSKSLVSRFLTSEQAQVLQKRLEERAKGKESWLSEWWNEVAYMGFRGRIIPWVSYFYIHKKGLGKGKSQEDRAAELVRGVVEFKKLVDSQRLEPEKVKGQPLCMASYKYLFNATRVPTKPADVPLAHSPKHNHVVVLRKNRFFKVDVEGRSAADLSKAFREIKLLAEKGRKGTGIGVLTVDDRDVWTDARQHLMKLSNNNHEAVEAIESAILLVCLDDGPTPKTETERGWMYWSGGVDRSPKGKAWNRWFDKHQIMVDESGESGFNGEHSMLDGTPTLRMNEFFLGGVDKGVIPMEGSGNSPPMPKPEELTFDLDSHLEQLIAKSQKGFAEEMGKQELRMVHFSGYGKGAIKTYKISPDAWAQMIKHLAFQRLFNRPGVTYESCQTRKYKLGRTEVIRTASAESKAFCDSMMDPKASDAEREDKLRKASARHIQYAAWAADGQGVDRHMFGLRMSLKPGENMPEVFKDEAYAKSGHWEMSTSQLSSPYLDGWGYGEVVDDGYGLSYEINDDSIRWCVTTQNGNAKEFDDALCQAATDIRAMMDRAKDAAPQAPKAKL